MVRHFAYHTKSQPLPCSRQHDGGHVYPICLDVVSVLSWYLLLNLHFWCWFHATPVGQAKNPGPDVDNIRLAVVNPTAVHGKTDQLVGLGADVLVVSETSATSIVQKESGKAFTKAGFKSYWSKPVAPKRDTLDSRPSYRGDAVGSAIFTTLPSRTTRGEISDTLLGHPKIFHLYYQNGFS